jgi:hypothetical protein
MRPQRRMMKGSREGGVTVESEIGAGLIGGTSKW